jgi:hypothetical protein
VINMIKYKIYTESILKSKTPLDKEQILASGIEQGLITGKELTWGYKRIIDKIKKKGIE